MYVGEWFGSSIGFIVVMLSAMGAAVGLVVYAALATMRGYAVSEAPEPRRDTVQPAPAALAEPVAIRVAD